MDTHNDNECSFECDNDCDNECDSDACVIDNDCSKVDIVECDDGSVNHDDDLNMGCGAEDESTLYENRWEFLNETQKNSFLTQAKELGRLIYSDLSTDSKNILKDDKTSTQDQREWLSDRNWLSLTFLSACTGVDIHEDFEICKKVNSLVHCVEQVLHARSNNLISPFAFRRNLLVHAETRSKLACQIAGGWEPAGGYTTISSFLMLPHEPAGIPDGNCNITIDNNQKIARSSGSICEGSSVPVSICTSVSYVTTRGLLGTRTSGHKILEVCIASKRWTCDVGDTQGYLRDDRHSTFKLTKFIYNIQTKLCSIQN